MQHLTNLAKNIEKERLAHNLSMTDWAHALGISCSAYKRLINEETNKLDVEMVANLYHITGKLLFEYYEVENPFLNVVSKLKQLDSEQLKFIESIIDREVNRNADKENKIR